MAGAMALRSTRDLPAFLRTPLTVDEARLRVQSRLETRDQRFLRQLDRTVFAYAQSPYRRLLAHAGCERGDLHALVAGEGLEGALRILAERDVYVSFDEFKGRRPAIRGSARFTFSDRDFDNPTEPGHYVVFTGGSAGRPARVARSLGAIEDGATALTLALDAFGIRGARALLWIGASPTLAMIMLKAGLPVDAWFYPVHPLPPITRIGLRYFDLLVRAGGQRMPSRQFCDLTEPAEIAQWLVRQAAPGRPVLVSTRTSSAVRIAATAAKMGSSLHHVAFYSRSEPFTPARQRQIEATGARAIPDYSSVELANMAFACPAGCAADDVHLFTDRFALIERSRPLIDGGPTVESLLLTSLSPHSPKIAFNTELGDSARVEVRECGCRLGELGLRTHLSEIRSFEKLSSEGTTFARSNVIQILEEILPARFGGSALDYQLVEEEGPGASTLLALRVAPSVGPIDEQTIRDALLAELGRGSMADAYQARLIERAQAIVVKRLPPLATAGGKVLPFQLRQPSNDAGIRR
jgi:hypothetical protein